MSLLSADAVNLDPQGDVRSRNPSLDLPEAGRPSGALAHAAGAPASREQVNFSIDENAVTGTVIGSVARGDGPATYTLLGNQRGTFAIDADGQITVADPTSVDFEPHPTLHLRVAVQDAAGLHIVDVTLGLNDVNEAPTIRPESQNAVFTVGEDRPDGARVGRIFVRDPDARHDADNPGDPTFSERHFSIDGGTGQGLFAVDDRGNITIAPGQHLDYESTPSYTLVVSVTDGAGLRATTTVTIDVADVDERPVASDQVATIDENAVFGAPVTQVLARDPEGGPLTYALHSGNEQGAFAIDADGRITVADPSLLDFERQSSFTLVVEVSDGHSHRLITVTVGVADVNEAPIIAPESQNATFGVDENSAPGALVGTLVAHDPDTGGTTSFSITGGSGQGLFDIDADGRITVAQGAALDHEATGSYTLVVAVTDDGGLSSSTTVTIAIDDVLEAPSLATRAASGQENQSIALSIASGLTDTAPGESLQVTIDGVPAGASLSAGVDNGDGSWTLTVAQLTGLTLTPPAGLSGSIALTVTATASLGGHSESTTVGLIVTIAPDTDAPTLQVTDATGAEDQPIVLAVQAALQAPTAGESLSITIAGVPAGASLSAGTDNGDGSWTLTAAQLTGLTLTAVADFSGTLALTVTASVVGGETPAAATQPLTVTVSPVADAPTLAVAAASGVEDQPIALSIGSALVAPAAGETLSLTIAGVPAGAHLSAGTDNGDGTWTLTVTQLSGLTIAPPADFSGTLSLTVTATASVSGSQASTSESLSVSVAPVADTPDLGVAAATGSEDQPIALSISAALQSPAAGEMLSITIAGVPTGATLSAGTDNGDGTWTLTGAQLTGLTLTPPADFSGTLSLTVTATASVSGTDASTSGSFDVTVQPVADAPTLIVAAATGEEDQSIALAIGAALDAPAAGETLSVTVAGIPAGAHLSAGTDNGDGTWTLTSAQLAGLTLTPPADFSGTLSLSVTATASVAGSDASTSQSLSVMVAPVADAPDLSVAASAGSEDEPIALSIAAALHAPATGETLSITIAGVPAGATLSAGTDNGDGTWSLSGAQLTGLTLTPPTDFSGNVSLTVTATAAVGGLEASTSESLSVSVSPVADVPHFLVLPAIGLEDQPIALAIAASLDAPADGETLSLTIAGIPAGATLSAGTDNGDGSWILTAAQLTGLTLTPPADFSGTLSLSVTATASVAGTDASDTRPLEVTVLPVADVPNLTTSPTQGDQDQPIKLSIDASLQSPGDGETLTVTIAGVPVGASLSAGTDNGDGTWTLTGDQLSGLTITPPADFHGDLALTVTATDDVDGSSASNSAGVTVTVVPEPGPELRVGSADGSSNSSIALPLEIGPSDAGRESITISGVPAGAVLTGGTLSAVMPDGTTVWSLDPADLKGLALTVPVGSEGTYDLTVRGIVTDKTGHHGITTETLTVTIVDQPGEPSPGNEKITLDPATAQGTQDQAIALDVSGIEARFQASDVNAVRIDGLPKGATLNHGTLQEDGSYLLSPKEMEGLEVTPPPGFSGDFKLSLSYGVGTGDSAQSVGGLLVVQVASQADTPEFSVEDSRGAYHTALALHVSADTVDVTGSEQHYFEIGGVPNGAHLSAGTNNGDGTWTVLASQIPKLTITPAIGFSGDLALTITGVAHQADGATATFEQHLTVTVAEPVETKPTELQLKPASGSEDTATDIGSSLSQMNTGGAKNVQISGVPEGATLSAGTLSGGVWTVPVSRLSTLLLTPGLNDASDISLSISGRVKGVTTPLGTLDVRIDAVADTPGVKVSAEDGQEGQPVALAIKGSLADTDGSETLSYSIRGVPSDASLSAGHLDVGTGNWILTASEVEGLQLVPAANFHGVVSLQITAIASELEGNFTTSKPQSLDVHFGPVTSAPIVTVLAAQGGEDSEISLHIVAKTGDAGTAHGTDALSSILISGLPEGATLNHGKDLGGGTYALTGEELKDLTVQGPEGFSGTLDLTITVTAQDEKAEPVTTITTLPVTVTAVADVPILKLPEVVKAEIGSSSALGIEAALVDRDGSEVLSVTISGVPIGALLSAGLDNGDGTWTLTQEQLEKLSITLPKGSASEITLLVTATALETANGSYAQSVDKLVVSVAGGGALPIPIAHELVGANIDLGRVGELSATHPAFLQVGAHAMPALSDVLHVDDPAVRLFAHEPPAPHASVPTHDGAVPHGIGSSMAGLLVGEEVHRH